MPSRGQGNQCGMRVEGLPSQGWQVRRSSAMGPSGLEAPGASERRLGRMGGKVRAPHDCLDARRRSIIRPRIVRSGRHVQGEVVSSADRELCAGDHGIRICNRDPQRDSLVRSWKLRGPSITGDDCPNPPWAERYPRSGDVRSDRHESDERYDRRHVHAQTRASGSRQARPVLRPDSQRKGV